jgi:DNA (cytosine-5)-methyltransferase 1
MSSLSREFTVISTFAGGGGSSLGYHMAGGDVRLAVEWDKKAADCYLANFPATPFFLGDIADLSVEKALEMSGLTIGELDIFDGSPPCQGFSTAGKRVVTDPRNSLFKEYVRLLRGLQPKAFVMENVSGVVKGAMRPVFRQIVEELKASGYRVKCRLLDAKWFGVPQERKRLIWIGAREDLGIEPEHPRAQGRPVTFRDACWDLRGCHDSDRMIGEIVRKYAAIHPDCWSTIPKLYRGIKGNISGSFSLHWAGWDRPIGTLLKQEIFLTGIVHPDRQRYISSEEARRLSSFPDSFSLPERKVALNILGNCVPPLLAKAIAETVFDFIIAPSRQQAVKLYA